VINLKINGKPQQVDVEGDTPLLWVLRDTLGLTGTKFGCGIAQCGACTVHVDGAAVRSCITSVDTLEDSEIRTIEGLAANRDHPVLKAWIAEGVPQCGYCQVGQIMAATALLEQIPQPTDVQIDDAMTNICRCGTYTEIRKAIHRAAATMKG
jgi:isoquinoline 1-oxidoreductase alpha subunit